MGKTSSEECNSSASRVNSHHKVARRRLNPLAAATIVCIYEIFALLDFLPHAQADASTILVDYQSITLLNQTYIVRLVPCPCESMSGVVVSDGGGVALAGGCGGGDGGDGRGEERRGGDDKVGGGDVEMEEEESNEEEKGGDAGKLILPGHILDNH